MLPFSFDGTFISQTFEIFLPSFQCNRLCFLSIVFFFVAGHISSLKRRPCFSLILPIRLLGLKFLAQQVYTVEEVSQRNHFPFFFYSFTSFSFQFVIFFDSLQLLEGDSGQEIKFLFIEPPFEKFSFPFFSIGRSYFPR